MMFDWTISVGALLNLLTLIIIGTGFIYTIRGRIEGISGRLVTLESDIKSLLTILIQQGKHEERMSALDSRLANQGARLDDLTRRYNDKLNNK